VAGIGKFALDTIDRINGARAIDGVCGILRQVGAGYGYTSFLITRVPMPGETLAQHVMLSGWPPEWMERYNSNDYVHVDPVANQIRTSVRPFLWSQVRYDPRRNRRAHQVMTEATEFGMRDGFTVPIYGYNGYQACVTMGGDPQEVSARELSALHMISVFGFSAVQALIAAKPPRVEPETFNLTERELEVLKWTSVGKTAWEISSILGISQRTVETHLKGVGIKMNVVNKIHAVALAIRTRLIS